MELHGRNLESQGRACKQRAGTPRPFAESEGGNRWPRRNERIRNSHCWGLSMSFLHKTTSISVILLTLSAGAQDTRQSPTQSPEIGYKSAADADQKKTLLLKDFNPTSMLHAAAHKV